MYDLVSFVVRGNIKKKVLENLTEPRTPTQLSEIIGTHRSTISRSIISLQEKGLVECITPNEHMGRYYKITELGRNVQSKIHKSETI
jgi:predicted transcriptional regulator